MPAAASVQDGQVASSPSCSLLLGVRLAFDDSVCAHVTM